jgi:hypothetical protein
VDTQIPGIHLVQLRHGHTGGGDGGGFGFGFGGGGARSVGSKLPRLSSAAAVIATAASRLAPTSAAAKEMTFDGSGS